MIDMDWDALLPAPPKAVAAVTPAKTPEAPEVADYGGETAAREREGDNRRRCRECVNLGERGVCLAAYRREIVASRSYTPIRDILRRCEGFAPMPDDPDQRHGRDRWPGLIDGKPGRIESTATDASTTGG